ncbi:MAG: class I SAM-dependent methyltransferase [Acidobacteriota bacterium]|nr:class I SAM-dependent methyltransferase [Acidobacteriota bacterium]
MDAGQELGKSLSMHGRISTLPGGHPVVYDAVMWPFERAAVAAWRRRLVRRAHGRVLEIGAGTGAQFRWYAPGVEVTALEPDPDMAARARRRAGLAAARIVVSEGRAEALPYEDRTFATAVSAFALCTVGDPRAVLSELWRVLVPDGRLFLLEHVHLPWEPGRTLQRWAAPVWAAVAGGCRLDRDTVAAAQATGFTLVRRDVRVGGWIVEAELVRAAESEDERPERQGSAVVRKESHAAVEGCRHAPRQAR